MLKLVSAFGVVAHYSAGRGKDSAGFQPLPKVFGILLIIMQEKVALISDVIQKKMLQLQV